VATYKQLEDVKYAITSAEASPEKRVVCKKRRVKGSPAKPGLSSKELVMLKEELENKAAILHGQSSGNVPHPVVPEQAIIPYR